ncbi:YqaA family protein [Oryzibacter oryziterrae]|uniref:YqaA family protein n=1 Tax=Oryzibacter oryziterrae TaxID=2766474 RepID=UPI001F2C8CE5|nr:YqaA family protein [Oryzibacter oryziterrae]
MFRKLYAWTMSLAASPRALWWLALVSFAESSFFPIPPDVILVPMVLARRDRAFLYALVCTLASVAGGILGYFIGLWLYDSVGLWLIQLYGYGQKMDSFRATFADYGVWIILIKGLTPIPFKLVTIASGFAAFNFPLFILLCAITRGFRFFVEAALLRMFGEPVRDFIEKRLEWVMMGVLVAIVGGFVIAKYTF